MIDARTRRFNANAQKLGLNPLIGAKLQGGWAAWGLSEDFQFVYFKKGSSNRKTSIEEAARMALRVRVSQLRANLNRRHR